MKYSDFMEDYFKKAKMATEFFFGLILATAVIGFVLLVLLLA